MKQTERSNEARNCETKNGAAMLNIFAAMSDDRQERLADKRIKVAAQLSALLAALKMSHAKIADKAHIKRPQLSRQLSGDANLTLDTITRICEAAGADFDVVFRKKSQLAAKQFWESESSELVRVVEARSNSLGDLRTAIEKLHVAGLQRVWNDSRAVTSAAYRMEMVEVNGQSGCVVSVRKAAANEKGNYEPDEPIAA